MKITSQQAAENRRKLNEILRKLREKFTDNSKHLKYNLDEQERGNHEKKGYEES